MQFMLDNPTQQAVKGCELDISFGIWTPKKICDNPVSFLQEHDIRENTDISKLLRSANLGMFPVLITMENFLAIFGLLGFLIMCNINTS